MANDIPYLDMVISETLRIYPVTLRVDRVPADDYEYNGMKIEKGTVWSVPIYVLHHDPVIYPNPDVFDPERFTPEAKRQLENNCQYLPFGQGPRICIGMRFATLEIKLTLCSILKKYEFQLCDKTPVNIVLNKSYTL